MAFDKGQYMFSSRCSACHTIGRGDNIGPDLLGEPDGPPGQVGRVGHELEDGLRAGVDGHAAGLAPVIIEIRAHPRDELQPFERPGDGLEI